MKTQYYMKIKSNGDLEFFPVPPPGLVVTELKSQRYSEIVPEPMVQRLAFRILRQLFGDEGRVASWTRTWHCLWECRILRGPATGACKRNFSRPALLDWEHRVWLTTPPATRTEKDLSSETKTKS
jgi:hypothetical protein